jgi:hypothetical protein
MDFKAAAGTSSISAPYANIDGRYYLISSKSTDLHWKGPPDVSIGFAVNGPNQGKMRILAKYNVSGVDLERSLSQPAMILRGQYFSQITVCSEDPNADLTLTVTREGEEIFKSQELKGVGTIEYKKGG